MARGITPLSKRVFGGKIVKTLITITFICAVISFVGAIVSIVCLVYLVKTNRRCENLQSELQKQLNFTPTD